MAFVGFDWLSLAFVALVGFDGLWWALVSFGWLWLRVVVFGCLCPALVCFGRLRGWIAVGPCMGHSGLAKRLPGSRLGQKVSDKPHMGDALLLLHHAGGLVLIIITYYTYFADPQTADQTSFGANFLRPLVAASHLDATIPRPPQYTPVYRHR